MANTNDNTNNNIEYIEFNSKIISKELNIKLIKNKKKLSYQNSFQIKRKNGIRTRSIKNYAWIQQTHTLNLSVAFPFIHGVL